jgi:hypothetical protein
MALGTPSTGTGSAPSWFSEYESDFSQLLQRLADNTTNQIDAKDVRDSIWTLYNQILTVASQSLTQSFSYTLATPSTIGVGGISAGTTFSSVSFDSLFDTLLLPYVGPVVLGLTPSNLELEFGNANSTSLSFTIDVGSSPLQGNIVFTSPNPSTLLNSFPSTGNDPEVGTTTNTFTPTFSSVVTLTGVNIATMSFTTADLNTFSATCSVLFKHKKYWGSIDLTSIGGFTPSSLASVSALSSFINDAQILGLSYSGLSTDFIFDTDIYFATGSHFVFAYPDVFGNLTDDGFYVNNIFSNGFTRIRTGVTFSNTYSYSAPYTVWVSDYPFNDVTIKVNKPE